MKNKYFNLIKKIEFAQGFRTLHVTKISNFVDLKSSHVILNSLFHFLTIINLN